MSLQAVVWISSKLGINIAGRGDDGETESTSGLRDDSSHASGFAASTETLEGKVSQYWNQIGGKVQQVLGTGERAFSLVADTVGQNGDGRGRGGPFSMNDEMAGENTEVDENGLPVSKNWYYYDEQLKRWNVSANAPDSIKQEFAKKLQDEEDERMGRKVVAPPPGPSMMRNPGGGLQPTPPQGLFATGTGAPNARSVGPQYAMPNYFDAAQASQPRPSQPPVNFPASQTGAPVYGYPSQPISMPNQPALQQPALVHTEQPSFPPAPAFNNSTRPLAPTPAPTMPPLNGSSFVAPGHEGTFPSSHPPGLALPNHLGESAFLSHPPTAPPLHPTAAQHVSQPPCAPSHFASPVSVYTSDHQNAPLRQPSLPVSQSPPCAAFNTTAPSTMQQPMFLNGQWGTASPSGVHQTLPAPSFTDAVSSSPPVMPTFMPFQPR